MKQCSKCQQVLALTSFRPRSNADRYRTAVSKVHGECRVCEHQRFRKWKAANPWAGMAYNLGRHYKTTLKDRGLTWRDVRDWVGLPERCYLCGDKIGSRDEAEIDHVIPLTQNGLTEATNLRWAHRRCNRMKHDLTLPQFIEQMHKMLTHLTDRPPLF